MSGRPERAPRPTTATASRIVQSGIFAGLEQQDVDGLISALVSCVYSAARRQGLLPPNTDPEALHGRPVRIARRRR
jgi:hypothetical protein